LEWIDLVNLWLLKDKYWSELIEDELICLTYYFYLNLNSKFFLFQVNGVGSIAVSILFDIIITTSIQLNINLI
jgi:hypothetical protein